MPDDRPSRLAAIPHFLREQLEALPERWQNFRFTLRDNPEAILQSQYLRIGLLVGGGLITIGLLQALVVGLTPGGTDQAFVEATPTATLYVACTNPDCHAAYTITREMDFADWPLTCRDCGQQTVYRADRCKTCGKWFATPPGATPACPHCAKPDTPAPAETPTRTAPRSHDDLEDPW